MVNVNQIRLITKAVKENLPAMFPDRYDKDGNFEVPKMLIFAKSDSHADDIINIVREEFAEENKFCKKITYRTEDPKGTLTQFRNSYYPRVAVTVDMIATGTDIKPLEVLLFMRDVKSRSYYEQMKGRGTRTLSLEDLRASGTPSAKFTKDHFVIIDAIGVEKSRKTDSRPLEKKPGLSLKQVLESIAMGNTDEAMLTTLANRLIRLDKQINEKEKMAFAEKANGYTLNQVVKQLLHAHDPDTIAGITQEVKAQNPGAAPDTIETKIQEQHQQLVEQAVAVFNDYELRDFVVDIRRKYDQIIDHINPDELVNIGWVKDNKAEAENLVSDFRSWIEAHKTEIVALQLFYGQPYQRRELTYKMMKELVEVLKADKPAMAPLNIWRAYEHLEKVEGKPKNEMMALVALIRWVSGLDEKLTAYDKTVDRNFQDWVFRKQAGALKFSEEQMQWLRMIKDYVANSFRIERDDFDLSPFNAHGGLGKMWNLFEEKTDEIMNELNEELAA
ncbi:type I restriction-modification enzyme R subunit C-terminal domain-containing protein [Pontibacter liquoris]|uniref:type I restriction-modification enzyme R subunit C-terminal domain-containing protein n=1 Tax=Pontibacter liquoris TaxID=2905677 RepID=UPI001FA74DAF